MIALMPTTAPQPNPELYSHVKVVISIIVGLCITTLLKGFAQFVQHPRRNKVSILHLGWAASLLLGVIHFWWWEFRLSMIQQWTFAIYFFVILVLILVVILVLFFVVIILELIIVIFDCLLRDAEGFRRGVTCRGVKRAVFKGGNEIRTQGEEGCVEVEG